MKQEPYKFRKAIKLQCVTLTMDERLMGQIVQLRQTAGGFRNKIHMQQLTISLLQHHPRQQYTVQYPGLNRPGEATQCWVMTAEHRSVRCQAHADLSKISRNEICISG
jgi:hypothetical protein